MKADRLTDAVLEDLMQHKSYTTTQKYVNIARQLIPAMANLYVPELPSVAAD